MRRKVLLVAATAFALVLVAAIEPTPAIASKIGNNLGREVQSWGKALLLGVAMLVGLPALAQRDFAQAMKIAGITGVLGGFVYAPGPVENGVETLWRAVA